MRKTRQNYQEARWRAKVSVGLALVGTWLGAWLWILHGFHWHIPDIQQIWAARAAIFGNPYFHAFTGLCGALGLWLAWRLLSRRQPPADSDFDSDF